MTRSIRQLTRSASTPASEVQFSFTNPNTSLSYRDVSASEIASGYTREVKDRTVCSIYERHIY